MLSVLVHILFRRNATRCISPYAIIMCVCVCVCVSGCVCLYAAFVHIGKTVWDRDDIFVLNCSKRHRTKPIRVLHKSDYKFQDGGQNGGCETLYLAVTQPFISMETSFFHWIVRNDTGHQLYKVYTNPITNYNMADKMAAVKHYN